MKKTVDIIGSCVIRDCFNSKFVPEYKKYFIVNTYLPRIAIPAIMSPAINYNDEILAGEKNRWYYECYYKSYGKFFLSTLANNQSNYLIIDFYSDAYRGVKEYGSSYVSYMENQKWTKSLDRTKFGKYYNYNTNQVEYKILWKQKFDEFMLFIKAYCPNTHIILNEIKGTNQILNSEQRHLPGIDLTRLNYFWKELDDYVLQKYPDVYHVSFEKSYRLNPDYPFGGLASEFVHFEKSYYMDFFEKLLQITNCKKDRYNTVQSLGGVISSSVFSGLGMFHRNLVKNGNFSQGLKYWTNCNSVWSIEKSEEKYYAKCCDNDLLTDKWCMSDAIEVNGDSATIYTLFFYIKVCDLCWKSNMCIIKILEFKNARDRSFEESLYCHTVKISEENKEREYFKTSYTICPKAKYVRIVMWLPENMIGSVYFSDITFVKGKNIANYQRCLDELYFEDGLGFHEKENISKENLLKNGDFSDGFKGWEYENASFMFKTINRQNWVVLCESEGYTSKYLWKWSESIKLPDLESWYVLSFDYFVYEKDSLFFEECMGIRGYDRTEDKKVKDAVRLYHVYGEALEINTVYHKQFSFQPKCKFIRVGIHLEKGKEHVSITNISLKKLFR